MNAPLHLFALAGSAPFGQRVARHLGVPLAAHEEEQFDDGEFAVRAPAAVRGGHACVIHALAATPEQGSGERLCRLLFFIGALRDAGAARVTAVLPYVAFARQDTRQQAGDPLTLRYVATLLEAAGADTVLTLDVHNLSAFQNAFRCRTEHLDGSALFAAHFAAVAGTQEVCVVAPDGGGIRRAEGFRQALARALDRPVALAFVEKHRHGGELTGDLMAGDVAGRLAIVFDDIIGTGGTMARAVRSCRERGAARVMAAATHAIFAGDAAGTLARAGLYGGAVADTVHDGSRAGALFAVLDSSVLFAQAIRCLHAGVPFTPPSGMIG
ncbi:ribose-phosphate diphosphokinase [Massilia dura]|uniref:ribose-phosphate diphosphokinase n=1 Tax=Pseudoduganella dura TaxID=321982 RepID=A0A6I3XUX1_9BURK|nr:ribose-phosphate diphosphokinase [Pseudoduganella dura]MUI15515.1 ribose-phosphate diphosphokinase [Pseudoduganella dura]GGY00245.1 ribose-phosphate pyrophosphokinase [Pseudoduganella dura]